MDFRKTLLQLTNNYSLILKTGVKFTDDKIILVLGRQHTTILYNDSIKKTITEAINEWCSSCIYEPKLHSLLDGDYSIFHVCFSDNIIRITLDGHIFNISSTNTIKELAKSVLKKIIENGIRN